MNGSRTYLNNTLAAAEDGLALVAFAANGQGNIHAREA